MYAQWRSAGGLLVCDSAGATVQRLLLPADVIATLLTFCDERGFTVVAYTTDDQIVAREANCHTDILLPFNEPTTRGIGPAMRDLGGEVGVYKMMLIDLNDDHLLAVRGDLNGL
ncbi:hypothetical protein T484DRAFT_1817428 [Baffinella frigidus]|nr:hypothetical protein T484DRAFT_1817428 [Cryptophyta sp. CCMP2293]